jgi:hypothetical protein
MVWFWWRRKAAEGPALSPEQVSLLSTCSVEFEALHNECQVQASAYAAREWQLKWAGRAYFSVMVSFIVAAAPQLWWFHNREDRVWRLRNPARAALFYKRGLGLLFAALWMGVLATSPWGFIYRFKQLDRRWKTYDALCWECKLSKYRCDILDPRMAQPPSQRLLRREAKAAVEGKHLTELSVENIAEEDPAEEEVVEDSEKKKEREEQEKLAKQLMKVPDEFQSEEKRKEEQIQSKSVPLGPTLAKHSLQRILHFMKALQNEEAIGE